MVAHRIRMRHLRCFLAVAKCGSVTRAAEELGTVQPSVSRSIRELEEQLGAPLFDRRGGRLSLNAAGQTMYAYASGGLGQIDHGIEALRGQMQERRVVVFALPNVIRMVMPGAVARFKQRHPEVEVELETVASGLYADRIRHGYVDFAFGRLNTLEAMEGVQFEPLYSEPLIFAVRRGHPLSGRQGLTVQDLDAYQVILPLKGTIIRDEIDRFLIGHGTHGFSNAIFSVSFEFSRVYLQTTDAVVCQPRGALRRELAEGTAEVLDFGTGELNGAVGLSMAAGKVLNTPAHHLMAAIREEVRELGLV
jgi:LysR family pca operon transcriptional activator